jgi:hypothetical protein
MRIYRLVLCFSDCLTPDKSDYRTNTRLVLHMDEKCVNQDLRGHIDLFRFRELPRKGLSAARWSPQLLAASLAGTAGKVK